MLNFLRLTSLVPAPRVGAARSFLLVALPVAVGLGGCGTGSPSVPVSAGGGNVLVYDAATAPSACPATQPNRHVVGDRVLCADAAFAVSATTRGECDVLAISCDQLYGCAATAPDLATCADLTTTTGDCGGNGPTVLGIRSYEARWFTGGCVAADFTPSPCSITDPCCVAAEPFAPDAGPYSSPLGVANEFLANFRADDAAFESAFRIPVTTGSLSGATGSTLTCTGSIGSTYVFNVACGSSWARDSSRVDDDSYRVFAHALGTGGLTVDFRPDGSGGQIARVCAYELEDIYPSICPSASTLQCADSGTVTLDTARIAVAVQFGAATVAAEFPR